MVREDGSDYFSNVPYSKKLKELYEQVADGDVEEHLADKIVEKLDEIQADIATHNGNEQFLEDIRFIRSIIKENFVEAFIPIDLEKRIKTFQLGMYDPKPPGPTNPSFTGQDGETMTLTNYDPAKGIFQPHMDVNVKIKLSSTDRKPRVGDVVRFFRRGFMGHNPGGAYEANLVVPRGDEIFNRKISDAYIDGLEKHEVVFYEAAKQILQIALISYDSIDENRIDDIFETYQLKYQSILDKAIRKSRYYNKEYRREFDDLSHQRKFNRAIGDLAEICEYANLWFDGFEEESDVDIERPEFTSNDIFHMFGIGPNPIYIEYEPEAGEAYHYDGRSFRPVDRGTKFVSVNYESGDLLLVKDPEPAKDKESWVFRPNEGVLVFVDGTKELSDGDWAKILRYNNQNPKNEIYSAIRFEIPVQSNRPGTSGGISCMLI